ncbi:1,6-dihydroxycyclohexa-2,4-diene-1-carboxylate dehydrogenase [Marinomonas mediterranea]|jgi:1,2-dihydroxycyclohexa-3,5-diene-1-carboxylate dehydrogenase (EC 1.3.1.25)|uniref:1,6-dihydroxycyclohexa-2,4-diene-1-carboxylate dehydrogenase n=1 Tax=Marinomonas mediterranea (strain ATCC 700492 / JCM 21426 / NBRC 103028 / MMB-1) TaxID=717774 RepID=F2JYV7_MARM1|nr:1,6-dihydroxycyclohexa-2,4-diene-1-carboxylate dehydrogenase [Marinomonas mediterranea]ADZ90822.1 1,6-dihydroxycyclohexa-2,4-diene-1-carboxylate dehydrogenase [Marinomonas mediterranea MMB-1]WCN08872.1 1,6-dihydroxycyclohexa-2,4-diene-1-carboxylate dehydrogenase [Marinomonas mediterranea]WCN12906.1 1,6-dihydroxycyclohexa-2,4-diene-1-carboxylate dehydrogenase [Marinomonas mediterranea]WCN16975.1 1,6-dihydroxycyclohexa-2,4-diene-1-carboxylate dehydrogenase [Marinomonas mediterranea MMB-1]
MRAPRFENKVAVVTGSAQSIGRQVALQMAQEHATLVLLDRSELIYDVAEEAKAAGAEDVLVIIADLEKFTDSHNAINASVEKFGRIDILINNVGGTIWAKPFEHYEEAQIEAEIRRSLYPTLWCCHAVLETMQRQKSGNIINVSSIATRSINRTPYSAAKGGVNAMTASLAFENAKHGIRVNAVAPGGTDVGERKIPRNLEAMSEQEKIWYQEIVDQTIDSSLMGRYSSTEEQANVILFFASDESSYLTGSLLPVGGGDLG